ncbi:syntaxin-17 [Tetranychus urticae]|uniref:t-SNARE coiled-coil homology domain-containing protein n=1 Tax=Tetranychus urticae TaxID=32264 RepID=T1KBU1_TETUR|nr:syntaxin-17 [Tetranychus urticae]XP_015785186.1 syntaxin-17 [Tetranychus urticae]XP_025016629.1 syntaxin-17 [Tetranychus urticae]
MVEAKSISSITLIKKNIVDFNDAIGSYIGTLDEHSHKLEKIDSDGDTRLLRRETFKCYSTMKKLDNLLKDLQNFEKTVPWEDLPEAAHLHNEIQMLKIRVNHSKDSFSNLVDHKVIINSSSSQTHAEDYSKTSDANNEPQHEQLLLQHELTEDINKQKSICESYLQLQRDIRDLDNTMKTFANIVASQEETIDNIESNIETALVSVHNGARELSKAAKLKRAFVPVTGAVVAGCVGGPVGALMGLKVGIVTAIGSAIIGYGGGKLIQKVSTKHISEADKHLSESEPIVNNVKKED